MTWFNSVVASLLLRKQRRHMSARKFVTRQLMAVQKEGQASCIQKIITLYWSGRTRTVAIAQHYWKVVCFSANPAQSYETHKVMLFEGTLPGLRRIIDRQINGTSGILERKSHAMPKPKAGGSTYVKLVETWENTIYLLSQMTMKWKFRMILGEGGSRTI